MNRLKDPDPYRPFPEWDELHPTEKFWFYLTPVALFALITVVFITTSTP